MIWVDRIAYVGGLLFGLMMLFGFVLLVIVILTSNRRKKEAAKRTQLFDEVVHIYHKGRN